MGTVADRLSVKLNQAFAPQQLEIHDDSAKHSGHAGAREGGESHFSVLIVSEHFEGLNRVARQRLVYSALAEDLAGPVHALSLQTLTPEESEKRGAG
jgi:BolA family transcriptional regulator, general stress-responsive regulator